MTRDKLKEWLGRSEARKRWEAEHPELAAVWSEAIAEDERRTRAAEQAQRELEALARMPGMLEACGAPRRCAEALASLRETPAISAARKWLASEAEFFVLLGAPGTGKSMAAAWLVAERIRPAVLAGSSPRSTLFVRAAEASRTASSDFDHADRQRFDRWCSVGLLVLDDLGTERAWDGWLSRLDELIDHRYGTRLRTVITSNLDGKSFRARYGDRIADRIRHDGQIVSAGATSLRRATA